MRSTKTALAVAILMAFGQQALAQTAEVPKPQSAEPVGEPATRKAEKAEKGETTKLDTVIVTAQKRKQSILDVATSVTVIGEQTITENNIQGVKDFFSLTPNVNAQEGGSGGPRTVLISMRGINDQGAGGERVAAVSAFGFYVDEFSVGNAATDTANPPLYDIQSIEVLRGPQGTYFGRNASGGVINIQTKKPEKRFFGQADFGLGTQKTIYANGVVNLPLSDTLYLRQTIQTQRDSGFVHNAHPTGGSSGTTLASSRTALRWVPTADTTADLSLSVTREDQGNSPKVSTGLNPNFGFKTPIDAARGGNLSFWPINQDKVYYNSPTSVANSSYIANAKVEQRFDTFSVTALLGHTLGRSKSYVDLDGSGLDVVDRRSHFTAKSSTAELRAASLGKNAVDWIVGAYAYKDSNDFQNAILIKGVAFGWVPGDIANENIIHIRRDGTALFADATWNMTPQASFSLGGRYSKDNDHQYWTDVYGANPGISLNNDDHGVRVPGAIYYPAGTDYLRSGGKSAQTVGTDGSNSGNDFSPRIALNYKVRPNFSVYGTMSQGYKSSGVRVNPDSNLENISRYKKEKLTNTEIGFKGMLFENTRIEGALFNIDWRDFQVPFTQTLCLQADGTYKIDDGTLTSCNQPVPQDRIINAKKARSRGFELAATSQVTNSVRVGASVGYANAKFVDYKTAETNQGEGDASNTPINQAPKHTGTLFVQWDGGLGDGDFYIRPELNYRDKYLNTIIKSGAAWPTSFGQVIPARTLLNLRAGYSWGKASLSASIENLTNKNYYTSISSSISGRRVDVHPRTALLRLTVTTD